MNLSSHCTQCGAVLTPDAAFCEQCGHRVESAAPPPPQYAPPPPPPLSPQHASPAEVPSPPAASSPLRGILVVLAVVALAGGAWFYRKSQPALPSDTVPPTPATSPTSPPLPTRPTPPPRPAPNPPAQPPRERPAPPPAADVRPPVEVAYIHFLDEAHRRAEGEIKVGSPVSTATRIEVDITAEGERHTVVVLEKSNDGTTAVVVVGPKDAGAFLTYTLHLKAEGWVVATVEESDG